MADFSRPEYKSYISLCRELALPRELRLGESFAYFPPEEGLWEPGVFTRCDHMVFYFCPNIIDGVATHIWLPSLSDWLDMLEPLEKMKYFVIYPNAQNGWTVTNESPSWGNTSISAPTREEAAARLWMAVRK